MPRLKGLVELYILGKLYERKLDMAGNRTDNIYSVKKLKQNFKIVIRTNYFCKGERKKKI